MPSARLLNQIKNPRTLDLPFFFRDKHITSLKSHRSLAPGESFPYWFGATFRAMFVLIHWLREFPLSAVANRFELGTSIKATVAIVLKNLSLLQLIVLVAFFNCLFGCYWLYVFVLIAIG